MQKGGFWLGGSDYGYGYPMDGIGYAGGYAMGGHMPGTANGYRNARSGYEVRALIASASILARDGQQQPCEDLLTTTRGLYKAYIAKMEGGGFSMADGPEWRRQQIAAAQPVATSTSSFRSDELLDADVSNPKGVALGSVEDIVISPTTGKIAYLVVARGGLFGIDQKYVPVPWDDFKISPNANVLVLDATKTSMDAAPEVGRDQFVISGKLDQQSQKVDAYWQTHRSSTGGN
jgi:sporulation protein YlmC with PRC-barrel domain